MENFNLSNIKRNWLKINFEEIINNYEDDDNMEKKFNEIIINNINNDKIIKYIIKILSFNIKKEENEIKKIKYYKLFLLLIKNFSKEDILKYLTNLLLFLQENINIISIEIGFELILKKIKYFKLKTFEILNGFCIHNMNQKENIIQKKALICYEKLIMNYNNCIEKKYKKDILKSFIDNIIINLENNNFIEKYQLLVCLNNIICSIQDKYIYFIDFSLLYILNYLSLNDYNIKLISLNIIYNIIKYNKEKSKEYINEINNFLIKLIKDESLDINIKLYIKEIFKLLETFGKNKTYYIENNEINNNNLSDYNVKVKKIKDINHNNKLYRIKSSKINRLYNKDIKFDVFFKK